MALLHFFQGFVDVDALKLMGHPEAEWYVPEVKGMTNEQWVALLDRAAEVGLLKSLGDGYYTIHPALPWYFKQLFDRHFSPLLSGEGPGVRSDSPRLLGEGPGVRSARAFVEAMGQLGNYYHDQYGEGNRDVIHALGREEANLLHARQLARQYGWWHSIISTMQGLRQLYAHTGRASDWQRLVLEIVPEFVDPLTDGPLPGQEEGWSLVIEYRVRLAEEARDWNEAERLQRVCVEWDRRQAAEALEALEVSQELNSTQRHRIRTLAVSIETLGHIQREIEKQECVKAYEEALDLFEKVEAQSEAAVIAFNLGHTYMALPDLRDLAQVETWYRRSLELRPEQDRLGQGKSYGQLGLVAYERFQEARAAQAAEEELLRHLNDALKAYFTALDLLPENAVHDLAVAHNQLGLIYKDAGDLDRALFHYREAIRYREAAGNLYSAGQTRYNVALTLRAAGRLEDALLYAQAALRNFQTFGDRAAAEIQKTQGLIERIEAG